MSTLHTSAAGAPFAQALTATDRDTEFTQQATLIPRSAMDHGVQPNQANSNVGNMSTQLDTSDHGSLTIESSLDTQSSLSHDSKVTGLVARYESYAGSSDDLEVPANEHATVSSDTIRIPSSYDLENTSVPSEEHHKTITRTTGHTVQGQFSPRKPIPFQWLAKSSGPNLATAQRAKERSHKKDPHTTSPMEMATVRGTRSSVDLGRANSSEGSTFLTKEALVAVESNIAAATSPRSPKTLHRSPSKPAWNSPSVSPLRSSLRQQSGLTVAVSPTKPTFLNAELTSSGHARGYSSAATSFHTAEGSSVRSSTGSELSFRTAEEILEDVDVPHLNLNADSETVQTVRIPGSSTAKGKDDARAKGVKPKLALNIPPAGPLSITDRASAAASTSASGSSDKNTSPLSPIFRVQTSRIPRIAAASKTGSTESATQGSMLEQAQPVKSLTSKAKSKLEESLETLEGYPANPSGTALTLARGSEVHSVTSMCQKAVQTDLPLDPAQHYPNEKVEPTLITTTMAERATAGDDFGSSVSSRATSSTTGKASAALKDPVLIDPAIIYNRKKPYTLGTMLDRPITMPPIIVMMAHTLDIGNMRLNDPRDDNDSSLSSEATATIDASSQIPGFNESYVADSKKKAASENSKQSSSNTDLRATAPEFVPQVPQQTGSSGLPLSNAELLALPLPDMNELDQYGVPWLYYMYPVHAAYQQGFHNGRSTSPPKRFKPKRQRGPRSTPTAGQLVEPASASTPKETQPAAAPPSEVPHRPSSAELMPPPPVPTKPSQGPAKHENSQPGVMTQQDPGANTHPNVIIVDNPFASQLDIINQQAALSNTTDTNAPRSPNVDLTSIRNVLPASGPHTAYDRASHQSLPYRGPRQGNRRGGNGLYGGSGIAGGVPMDATAPFPDPIAPRGRRAGGRGQVGPPVQYITRTIGTEACGIIEIEAAMEQIGGMPCHACQP
ncbi:hypothetical protein N0V83_009572 [Neocucurbitaria cava]|uniref:Uncharacterized protein n=1 Tax=Neocucurbitaria cava TaxID=798079 RepID=A0A9W8Y0U6_9PLEO|nr:hypothetical protein N0V83_009572 [Neocucurbitaria cava]